MSRNSFARDRGPRVCMFIAVALAGNTGCATLDNAPVGHAAPVSDWDGVAHLSRDGAFYFASQPTKRGLEIAPTRGVKTIVNLRTPEEIQTVDYNEEAAARELGMNYVSIPIESAEGLSLDDADRLADVLKDCQGGVLMHCKSASRAGGLWALYLNRHRGMELEDALERGRQAGMRSPAIENRVRQLIDDETR